VFAQGVGGIGPLVFAQGVGGIGPLVFAHGVGGIGPLVLASSQGVGGIGPLVFASVGFGVSAFKPIQLTNTSRTNTAAINHLLIRLPPFCDYAGESISGWLPSRGIFTGCVSKRYTPLPPWPCQSLSELS
jgi:hypothetical protein